MPIVYRITAVSRAEMLRIRDEKNTERFMAKQKRELPNVEYRFFLLSGWLSSDNPNHFAKAILETEWPDRGEKIVKKPLYRVLYLRGVQEITSAGLKVKPRAKIESWSADIKSSEYFVRGGGLSTMIYNATVRDDSIGFNEADPGGIVIRYKHTFTPNDVVLYLPNTVTMFDKAQQKVLLRRGIIRQNEVLVKARPMLITKKDIQILKVVKPSKAK